MPKIQLQDAQENTVKNAVSDAGLDGSTGTKSAVMENPAGFLQLGQNGGLWKFVFIRDRSPLWEYRFSWSGENASIAP